MLVEVVNVIDLITVDNAESIGLVQVEDTQDNLIVDLSISDMTAPVLSVNGKTGNVIIDYPDIGEDPVNHVKYEYIQASLPIHHPNDSENIYRWGPINHNLNFHPNVTVIDSGNNTVEAYVEYNSKNSVTIYMNARISGSAFLT